MKMVEQKEFLKYVEQFYGNGGIYDMGATPDQIEQAYCKYLAKPNCDFVADSFDRENIRDILIEEFGLKLI